tara:strand:+ start:781 stop:1305 length:525 start_codon:yes stop_codon:yes gene_type:complete
VINKKFLIIISLLILIPFKSYSQNFAYADMDKIVRTSEVGKKIILYFQDKNNNLVEKVKLDEKNLREKEKSLVSQKNILQDDEYNRKVNEIQIEINNLNEKNSNELKSINNEKNVVTKSFLDEINKILKEFAETNKIDIIISSNQILIGKSNLDVTDEILKIVNSKIRKFEIKK